MTIKKAPIVKERETDSPWTAIHFEILVEKYRTNGTQIKPEDHVWLLQAVIKIAETAYRKGFKKGYFSRSAKWIGASQRVHQLCLLIFRKAFKIIKREDHA